MKSNQTMNMCLLTGVVIAIALTTGCASGPTRVEADYGNSVRAMQRAQVLDPVAAATVDTTPVTTTDGQRMENVLNTYRNTVGEPTSTSQTIEFDIGD
jgi:type IV pilus biogenesis protein CpaD/CtpE